MPGSVALCAIVLASCTTEAPVSGGGLPREQAARARPVQDVTETVPPSVRRTGGGRAGPTDAPTATPSSPAPAPAAPYVAVLDLADRPGDNGLQAPDYADLEHVRISSNGANARMTITVGAALPARLAEGEVMGIGIDLYPDDEADESDYQLFAEGSDDGWFAWRHTPDGLDEYVGAFEVGGATVVFEVPWSALGDPADGVVRVFLDWSEPGVVLNAAGSDRAPQRGRAPFAR